MTGKRTARIGSVIFVLLFALYGVLAFSSGMDRLSGTNPSRASLVPSLLRASSARVEAGVALSRSEFRQAEELAKEALAASPRNERVAGMLASAQILRGDPWAAERAMVVAKDGGWRDPVVQAYWTNERQSQGAAAQAIEHLEALMLTQPHLAVAEPLLTTIASDADSRAALIDRVLAHEPFARALFKLNASDLSTAAALRGDLLLDPAMDVQPHGCSIAGDVIEGLAERQMSQEAEAVAAAHCAI